MSNRQFGNVFAILLAALGLYPLKSDGSVSLLVLALAGGLALVATIEPDLLAAPKRWWIDLGFILQSVISTVLVGGIFLLLVTPTGLILRLVGKKPFLARFDRSAPTYWKKPERPDIDLFRQF